MNQKKIKVQSKISVEYIWKYPQKKKNQTESNNILKESYIMINWGLSQWFKGSSIHTNQYDTLLTNCGGKYDTLNQFSSVAQSCPTLCDPENRSMPGIPVHHQLPELAQSHIHRVGDAIQPSHSLLSPSPPTFDHSQHQGLFQWVSSSHQVAKILEFQLQHQSFSEHSGLISFRMDWLDLLALSRVFSNTTVQKYQFFCTQLS